MTVETSGIRYAYAGNGSTTVFSFPRKFRRNSDLVVILKDDETGEETVQTITTHYSVTGAGNNAGGSVTMVTAPAVGETLVIYADPAPIQELDLEDLENMPAGEIEDSLDHMILVAQRLKDRADRSVRLSEGFSDTFDTRLPALLAQNPGAVFVVNEDGSGFAIGPTADQIAGASISADDAASSAAQSAAEAAASAASAAAAAASVSDIAAEAAAAQAARVGAEAAQAAAEAAVASIGTAVTDAQAAQAAAEAAQTAAETAQAAAEDAATAADVAATDAETAQAAAEAARDQAIVGVARFQTFADDAAYEAAKGSAAADGDAYYNTTDDVVRVYQNGVWTDLGSGSGGGGGGSSLKWIEGLASALPTYEHGVEAYLFESGGGQSLYALVKVPASYIPGNPINLRTSFYSPDVVGTVLLQAIATLIRTGQDAISSSTNQHTSTNSALDLSTSALADKPYAVDLDLSSSDGEINNVAVSPGDLIKVQLMRGTDTAASDVRALVYGSEVTFN